MLDIWEQLAALPEISTTRRARAAVLVPLYAENGDGQPRVLLTRRPETMRTHPGDVVFPGGRIEEGETPIVTAMREAREEVGIGEEHVVEVLGGLTPVSTRNIANLIVPVVVRIERPADLAPNPHEVDAIIEPTLAELLNDTRWRHSFFFGRRLWFYQLDEGVLWGANAFIMRELLGYLRR